MLWATAKMLFAKYVMEDVSRSEKRSRHAQCGSVWSSLVSSELGGVEAERAGAGTLGVGEILGQFCGGESREFFVVERSHHRAISVLHLPLVFS